MAIRVFARLSIPLTQCFKYSVNSKLASITPSKFASACFINIRNCQTSRDDSGVCDNLSAEDKASRKKNNITLVFPDGTRELLSLARAERIAENRNSELVDVHDDADCRVVYRLVPLNSGDGNGNSEVGKKEKSKKQPKGIDINTTTTERDLLVKCKKIVKMVQNNHVVRIQLHNAEKIRKTTSTPEQEIRDILQKAIQDLGTIREESRNERRAILIIEPLRKDVQEK